MDFKRREGHGKAPPFHGERRKKEIFVILMGELDQGSGGRSDGDTYTVGLCRISILRYHHDNTSIRQGVPSGRVLDERA